MGAETRRKDGPIARVGGFCFHHRWWVIGVWLIVAVGGFYASGKVFNGLSTGPGAGSLESVQGYNVLDDQSKVGETVVGEFKGVAPGDASVRAAVAAATADIKNISGVREAHSPYDQGLPSGAGNPYVAKDGSGLIVDVTLNKMDSDPQQPVVDSIKNRLGSLQSALRAGPAPHSELLFGGGAVLDQQVNDRAEKDVTTAEELSLPITLIILIFVFGGILAAGMPIFAAIISVFGGFLALLGFEHITNVDQNGTIVVTLLGLGLSIDYGLLLIARYREELARGADAERALSAAWSSAGRTILFSALTVAGSLCGLVAFGVTSMTALGVAGVSIAIVAMLIALTSTAALIGFARKRLRPSKRALRRIQAAGDGDTTGFFARLARLTQRRPLVSALLVAVVLLGLAAPALGVKPSINGMSSLPKSLSSVQVDDDLAVNYGKPADPAVMVVARTDPAALDTWAARWTSTPGVASVGKSVQEAPGLSSVSIYVSGDAEGGVARNLVDTVRADRPQGVKSWVTGDAALLNDVLGLIGDRLPWAIAITVVAMLVLLFLMTGSLVVPIKAIVMNGISLGATVGVMTLVFQHGFATGVLHALHTGSLDPFVMLGVLAFAFGLSMDYEVFLLSRIKEYVDQGLPTDVAVRRGLQRSGRVITSAALLMVIVFACFLVGRTGNTQQIGLGLAAAIALDATLVRCVLVPATMTVLGKWNWWAPKPLARWHARISRYVTEAPSAHDDTLEPAGV